MVIGTGDMHWKELIKSEHKVETGKNSLKIIISSTPEFLLSSLILTTSLI